MDQIAFARGVPSPDALPLDEIRKAADRALAADGKRILSYGTGGGYPPLRELLAQRHGVDPSQVVVTTGSLMGFGFLVRQILRMADANTACSVVVENPTYDRPLIVLGDAGAEVVSVPLDADGIDVEQLAPVLERQRPALMYLIPTFQNPAGATLSQQRRTAVLELAVKHGVTVLEDDPYGELWFDQPPPATMFSRRGDTEVLYSSSFSKTIAPGLRVGYVVLPQRLAAGFAKIANDTYISATLLGQAIVAEFLDGGLLQPSIDNARSFLRARCDAMCDALDEHLPALRYVRPGGGYFLWGVLPAESGITGDELLPVAEQHGVSFVPGSAFGEGQQHALRLAFSYPSVEEVREGVRRLAAAVAAVPAHA